MGEARERCLFLKCWQTPRHHQAITKSEKLMGVKIKNWKMWTNHLHEVAYEVSVRQYHSLSTATITKKRFQRAWAWPYLWKTSRPTRVWQDTCCVRLNILWYKCRVCDSVYKAWIIFNALHRNVSSSNRNRSFCRILQWLACQQHGGIRMLQLPCEFILLVHWICRSCHPTQRRYGIDCDRIPDYKQLKSMKEQIKTRS